jgi:hypothetical protein
MAVNKTLIDVYISNGQEHPIYYTVRIDSIHETICKAIVFGGTGFFKTEMNTYFDLLDSDHINVQKLLQAPGEMHSSGEGMYYDIDGKYTGR